MGFHIDLNETPVPSPRETVDEVSADCGASVCPVCKKGISVGRVLGKAAEERQESKGFRGLLRIDAARGSRGGRGGEVGRFDMNASPPQEPDDAIASRWLSVRDDIGGGKYEFYLIV